MTAPSALLLYPPVTDPTSPYHSLVYLASHAHANGFPGVEVRDTNIEALHHCARPDVLRAMMRSWEARRRALGQKASLSRLEQLEYRYLARAEALDPDSPARAIAALRDPEAFYDYATYRHAVRQLRLWTDGLSCDAFPGQFTPGGNALRTTGLFNLSSVADLSDPDILDRVVGPFRAYYHEELFPSLRERAYPVVGINVTYTSQLPYALWLVRRLRRLLPGAYLVCGGTEVSGVWKYLADRQQLGRLFGGADALVVGEGESAFLRILEAVGAGRRPGAVPNLVHLDARRGTFTPPPGIAYEDLNSLPTPRYELMRDDLYFAPHTLVYYSPTRGCYWNKCTFCDYGLNFGTPTSPWRQRSLEGTVRDLRAASAYTPYVYLSVDVLAPGPLVKLAQAVADAGLALRWSAEVRLEKYFIAERCDVLRRSGCVSVSVGFESGSQRVLDRIRKGTSLEEIATTIRHFTEAGIAVQMMGFTGFPTESHDEAMQSVSYLLDNGPYWTVAGLDEFTLTPGAIVAQHPLDFNLADVRPLAGDDIARSLTFRELGGPAKTPHEEQAVRRAKGRLNRAEFDRPYAGGIDTPHSVFYYSRYGLRFPRAVIEGARPSPRPWDDDVVPVLNGKLLPAESYDLMALFDSDALEALHESAHERGVSLGAEALEAELGPGGGPAFPLDRPAAYFLRRDGAVLPCPPATGRLLAWVDGERTLEEVVRRAAEGAGPEEAEGVRAYARMLKFLAGADFPDPPAGGLPLGGEAESAYRLLAHALAGQQVLTARAAEQGAGSPAPEAPCAAAGA